MRKTLSVQSIEFRLGNPYTRANNFSHAWLKKTGSPSIYIIRIRIRIRIFSPWIHLNSHLYVCEVQVKLISGTLGNIILYRIMKAPQFLCVIRNVVQCGQHEVNACFRVPAVEMDKANQPHFVSLSSFYMLLKRCRDRAAAKFQKAPTNEEIAKEMMKSASVQNKTAGIEMVKRLKGALDSVSIDNIELLDADAIDRFLKIPSDQRAYQSAKDIFNNQVFLSRKCHWISLGAQRGPKKPRINSFEEQAEVAFS